MLKMHFKRGQKLIEQNRTAYFTGNCFTRLVLSGVIKTKNRHFWQPVNDLLTNQWHQ